MTKYGIKTPSYLGFKLWNHLNKVRATILLDYKAKIKTHCYKIILECYAKHIFLINCHCDNKLIFTVLYKYMNFLFYWLTLISFFCLKTRNTTNLMYTDYSNCTTSVNSRCSSMEFICMYTVFVFLVVPGNAFFC